LLRQIPSPPRNCFTSARCRQQRKGAYSHRIPPAGSSRTAKVGAKLSEHPHIDTTTNGRALRLTVTHRLLMSPRDRAFQWLRTFSNPEGSSFHQGTDGRRLVPQSRGRHSRLLYCSPVACAVAIIEPDCAARSNSAAGVLQTRGAGAPIDDDHVELARFTVDRGEIITEAAPGPLARVSNIAGVQFGVGADQADSGILVRRKPLRNH